MDEQPKQNLGAPRIEEAKAHPVAPRNEEPTRRLRTFVRGADRVVNAIAITLFALLALYAGYSLWYTQSLLNGSFLSDELAMYKPDGHEPTLAELMEINPDVRAWLTIDDTHIDYPVVQGATDSEYLNKSVEGEFSLAGAIFLCAQNAPDFSDPYNMVYGHHIEGGAMFSDVLEFTKKRYFDEHRSGILWLADRAYSIQLFACIEVDGRDDVVYQDPVLVTDELLPGVVDNIVDRSTQKRSVDIASGDSIIALSTCEDATTFERVVVLGKLVPMTDEEMRAAEAANYAKQLAEKDSGGELAPSFLDRHPWVLPTAGALLALLLLYVLYRLLTRNKN